MKRMKRQYTEPQTEAIDLSMTRQLLSGSVTGVTGDGLGDDIDYGGQGSGDYGD